MAKMNRTTISRRTVGRLAADRDTVYWDSELRGFGVRVYRSRSMPACIATVLSLRRSDKRAAAE